jgi:hypothetical protein
MNIDLHLKKHRFKYKYFFIWTALIFVTTIIFYYVSIYINKEPIVADSDTLLSKITFTLPNKNPEPLFLFN